MSSLPTCVPTHIVVFAVGTAGNIYPMLRLAVALRQRGHQVTFIAPELHQRYAQQAGVPFRSLVSSEEYHVVLNNPDAWHPRKSIGVLLRGLMSGLLRASEPTLEFLSALPAQHHCVLLTHPLALPLVAIARAARPTLRVVAVYLAPSNLRTVHDPLMLGPMPIPRWVPAGVRRWLWRRIDKHMIDPAALPGLNVLRQTKGLPPIGQFFEHLYGTADLSLTLFPPWFAATQPDWPQPHHPAYFQLYDSHPEQAISIELEQFLSAGDAPIVFTPGTGNVHAAAYFACALQAVQRLSRRAIFLTQHPEQVPPTLPDSVLWQAYVPLRALLPRIAVLVHHGGIGTTAEALRAGVPQLVVPLAHDQFDNGARVRALGVGASLPNSRLRVGTLARKLRVLLSSESIRMQCQIVARRFTEDDDEEALCNAIENA